MRLKNFSLTVGSQIFKALSDTARVRILYLLTQNKEMCISDLELILDFTQTKTSRHLIYLKNSGLLTARKVDQWVFYSVKDEMQDLLGKMMDLMARDQQLLRDQRTFKVLYSNRELALYKINHRGWKV
ncbi:MAG: metalloregulator ArsR/SmtB family transcription factor [Cytophagales bacterium]|nr:metalloregulator ArsR/SmtB family transcription factor [Cytophagales bacterium]